MCLKVRFHIVPFITIIGTFILAAMPTAIDKQYFNLLIPEKFDNSFVMFRLEALQNLVLFYVVLFFTSVVGIVELLPEIKRSSVRLQIMVQFLFFGLVTVFDLCVIRVWNIFLESALLTRIELAEWQPYKEYALHIPSIIDEIILDRSWSKPVVVIIVLAFTIFFSILYNYKYFDEEHGRERHSKYVI